MSDDLDKRIKGWPKAERYRWNNLISDFVDALITRDRKRGVELDRLRKELVGEIRSELALASAYCANATIAHCRKRLAGLAADAAAPGSDQPETREET